MKKYNTVPITTPTPVDEGLALAEAIWTRMPGRLKELLSEGCDPNATTPDGSTPLALACKRGDIKLMSPLLEAGADPNMITEGRAPLTLLVTESSWSSMIQDRWRSIRLLLEAGADVEVSDQYDNTVLDHAWENGNGEALTRLMLDLDMKPIIPEPATRLISAVKRRQVRQVQSLLSLKINPDVRAATDEAGMTPLMIAAEGGDYDTTQLLLSYKADPSMRTIRNQRRSERGICSKLFVPESNALEFAVKRGIYRVIQTLLVASGPPKGRPSEHRLIELAQDFDREDIKELLEHFGYGLNVSPEAEERVIPLFG